MGIRILVWDTTILWSVIREYNLHPLHNISLKNHGLSSQKNFMRELDFTKFEAIIEMSQEHQVKNKEND